MSCYLVTTVTLAREDDPGGPAPPHHPLFWTLRQNVGSSNWDGGNLPEDELCRDEPLAIFLRDAISRYSDTNYHFLVFWRSIK